MCRKSIDQRPMVRPGGVVAPVLHQRRQKGTVLRSLNFGSQAGGDYSEASAAAEMRAKGGHLADFQ